VDNRVQHGDSVIGILVHLVENLAGLAEHLAVAFNSVCVSFKAHENHSTIVIITADLDRVRARHHRRDRMVNNR